ncbi:dihydrofolate reductase [Fusobacterium sp. PH5-7]|uniref:dihydrofolate reductase n=1 Tax=Fusobacterium sp. PH5-7 TaxID=2940528 RepID=UPI00247637E6|nr:dihydrofolate reductase family protein [Fusobacterium sp. PH5-7]MDH6458022.1 dihydrofolate reductase [Fusobacterium sp. PH5-7]
MNKPKLNMIVCVGENNLIGDRVPEGNGLLWHSMEELNYYKSKTIGNVVLFGENTAKYVPINLMKKNREVIVLTLDSKLEDIMEQYKNSGKNIFICGGYTIYKYYLDNYEIDEIYISKLKPHVEVAHASNPLYFPDVEKYGYKLVSEIDYNDFTATIYKK